MYISTCILVGVKTGVRGIRQRRVTGDVKCAVECVAECVAECGACVAECGACVAECGACAVECVAESVAECTL